MILSLSQLMPAVSYLNDYTVTLCSFCFFTTARIAITTPLFVFLTGYFVNHQKEERKHRKLGNADKSSLTLLDWQIIDILLYVKTVFSFEHLCNMFDLLARECIIWWESLRRAHTLVRMLNGTRWNFWYLNMSIFFFFDHSYTVYRNCSIQTLINI